MNYIKLLLLISLTFLTLALGWSLSDSALSLPRDIGYYRVLAIFSWLRWVIPALFIVFLWMLRTHWLSSFLLLVVMILNLLMLGMKFFEIDRRSDSMVSSFILIFLILICFVLLFLRCKPPPRSTE